MKGVGGGREGVGLGHRRGGERQQRARARSGGGGGVAAGNVWEAGGTQVAGGGARADLASRC